MFTFYSENNILYTWRFMSQVKVRIMTDYYMIISKTIADLSSDIHLPPYTYKILYI